MVILCGLLISCANSNGKGKSEGEPSHFYSGNGAPAKSLGQQYDHYLDLNSRYVYEKNGGVWYNKYSLGSDILLDSTSKRVSRLSNDELKYALCNTFYSTNISYHYYLQQPHNEYDSTLRNIIDFEITKDIAHVKAMMGEMESNIYYRSNNGIDQYYYIGQTEGFVDVDTPNLYCSFPYPSIENTPHCYYGIEDTNIGEFNALVVSQLNTATYDEESGFYTIEDITGTHNGINYKGWTVAAGTVVFTATFKLSEDKEYVSVMDVTVKQSPSPMWSEDERFVMEFYNYHNTNVVLPQ